MALNIVRVRRQSEAQTRLKVLHCRLRRDRRRRRGLQRGRRDRRQRRRRDLWVRRRRTAGA